MATCTHPAMKRRFCLRQKNGLIIGVWGDSGHIVYYIYLVYIILIYMCVFERPPRVGAGAGVTITYQDWENAARQASGFGAVQGPDGGPGLSLIHI